MASATSATTRAASREGRLFPAVEQTRFGFRDQIAAGAVDVLQPDIATPCATTVEFSRGENPLLHELVEESFELRDGAVLAPERPGLGLTLRREFARSR